MRELFYGEATQSSGISNRFPFNVTGLSSWNNFHVGWWRCNAKWTNRYKPSWMHWTNTLQVQKLTMIQLIAANDIYQLTNVLSPQLKQDLDTWNYNGLRQPLYWRLRSGAVLSGIMGCERRRGISMGRGKDNAGDGGRLKADRTTQWRGNR